jgi:nucleotide-binding universal stress UspA family protein
MPAYRTIVVGTDGSERSMSAVERAGALAADSGSRLVIVCAYHPAGDRETRRATDALRDEAYQVIGSAPAESSLRTATGRARARGARDIVTRAVSGEAPDVLAKAVAEADADLLVVGNRGLNTLVGRLLGSVPSAVARHAGCDVTIVRTGG